MSPPRVAFFADSFSEVNGVAHTCRTLTALAARHEMDRRLRAFCPDVVHITGPGDVGTLGLLLAKSLGIPICAS